MDEGRGLADLTECFVGHLPGRQPSQLIVNEIAASTETPTPTIIAARSRGPDQVAAKSAVKSAFEMPYFAHVS